MEKEDYQENWDEGMGKECLFFFLTKWLIFIVSPLENLTCYQLSDYQLFHSN